MVPVAPLNEFLLHFNSGWTKCHTKGAIKERRDILQPFQTFINVSQNQSGFPCFTIIINNNYLEDEIKSWNVWTSQFLEPILQFWLFNWHQPLWQLYNNTTHKFKIVHILENISSIFTWRIWYIYLHLSIYIY